MNYTEEQRDYIVREYQEAPSRETVERLANELDKTIKSIIGKLSREGVYRREVYKTKTGEDPITKAELVVQISEALGIDVENLAGLEKAPKLVLKKIESTLGDLL